MTPDPILCSDRGPPSSLPRAEGAQPILSGGLPRCRIGSRGPEYAWPFPGRDLRRWGGSQWPFIIIRHGFPPGYGLGSGITAARGRDPRQKAPAPHATPI
jgi:hypothetical protein